jgi:hypothetical protein
MQQKITSTLGVSVLIFLIGLLVIGLITRCLFCRILNEGFGRDLGFPIAVIVCEGLPTNFSLN